MKIEKGLCGKNSGFIIILDSVVVKFGWIWWRQKLSAAVSRTWQDIPPPAPTRGTDVKTSAPRSDHGTVLADIAMHCLLTGCFKSLIQYSYRVADTIQIFFLIVNKSLILDIFSAGFYAFTPRLVLWYNALCWNIWCFCRCLRACTRRRPIIPTPNTAAPRSTRKNGFTARAAPASLATLIKSN